MDIANIIGEKKVSQLKRKKNVVLVGTGIKYKDGKCTDESAIIIGVVKKEPLSELSVEDIIPTEIDGMTVDVQTVGKVEFLTIDRTREFRPVPGGVSIGEKTVSAGTSNPVYKKGELRLLSNNHVFAACNEAEIGSAILQPGSIHGGNIANHVVARLSEFVPIKMSGDSDCPIASIITRICNFFASILHSSTRILTPISVDTNTVDCALARPIYESIVTNTILEDGNNYIEIAGEEEAYIGQLVKKTGTTTGTTRSSVKITDATIEVGLSDGRHATFVDQIGIPNPFGEGGDSGSLILTEDNRVLGLLFAGSSVITFANRWENVKDSLGLDDI